jgi:hypothetical protein
MLFDKIIINISVQAIVNLITVFNIEFIYNTYSRIFLNHKKYQVIL